MKGGRTGTELEDRDEPEVEDERGAAEDAKDDRAAGAEEQGEGQGLRLRTIAIQSVQKKN
jgi:hypothetical protein